MKLIALALILLSVSSELHSQEIRYVRDQLWVPLRSGPTAQHRIVHKGLVSGTQLTVISTNDDQSYTQVRTNKGTEGWIQTQYLSKQAAARNLLAAANTAAEKLRQQNTQLKGELKNYQDRSAEAKKQLSGLSSQSSELAKELEQIKIVSANAIQLNADNQRLLEETQMLRNEVDVLTTDNQRLNDEKDNDDFLNGAFAVLIGVMIALIVPRLRPKKSTDWA